MVHFFWSPRTFSRSPFGAGGLSTSRMHGFQVTSCGFFQPQESSAVQVIIQLTLHLSSVQNLGWLLYIEDDTTHLYILYGYYFISRYMDPYEPISIMECQPRALNAAQLTMTQNVQAPKWMMRMLEC